MATEDFTTYTEVDPNNHLSQTTTRATFTGLLRAEVAYCYKDKGVDHFVDFEHLLDVNIASATEDWAFIYFWALWNDLGSVKPLDLAEKTGIMMSACRHSDDSLYFILREVDAGTVYSDNTYGAAVLNYGTTYYLTIERSGAAFTCRIYGDSARTDLKDTLSLTLQTETKFKYIYATQSDGSLDIGAMTGYCENLDLQEIMPMAMNHYRRLREN